MSLAKIEASRRTLWGSVGWSFPRSSPSSSSSSSSSITSSSSLPTTCNRFKVLEIDTWSEISKWQFKNEAIQKKIEVASNKRRIRILAREEERMGFVWRKKIIKALMTSWGRRRDAWTSWSVHNLFVHLFRKYNTKPCDRILLHQHNNNKQQQQQQQQQQQINNNNNNNK